MKERGAEEGLEKRGPSWAEENTPWLELLLARRLNARPASRKERNPDPGGSAGELTLSLFDDRLSVCKASGSQALGWLFPVAVAVVKWRGESSRFPGEEAPSPLRGK